MDINKHTDWETLDGQQVQEFIKKTFEGKFGVLYYDSSNNRYIVFADEENRDKYLADTTQTTLILGTFDAPFNYSASIALLSPSYAAIPKGKEGNYIQFTFDTVNKQGQSVGEDVIVTYTITRGAVKTVVTEQYRRGTTVNFNVDKYLDEGTNNITIGVVGKTTLAATTVGVTFLVVDLALSDEIDISKVYTAQDDIAQVSFSLSGYGRKIVEWWIDGEQLPFETTDEVVESAVTRTKNIPLSAYGNGVHRLDIRAYTTVEGEKFYTEVLTRDLMFDSGESSVMIATAYERANLDTQGIEAVQYVPCPIRIAVYNPAQLAVTPVNINAGDTQLAQLGIPNGSEVEYNILMSEPGVYTLVLTSGISYSLPLKVTKTTMAIAEITESRQLNFRASGRSNNSFDKETWVDGERSAEVTGIAWNRTSGWINNSLVLTSGGKIEFNYAPLAVEATAQGKTIEIELASKNVTNDDAVLCDLLNSDDVGLLITASSMTVRSRGGSELKVRYKSEENIRLTLVINRRSGVTNKGLIFIYVNGILSGATTIAASDRIQSDALLSFSATDQCEIALRQVLCYDNALTSDQVLNNYILYQDSVLAMTSAYNRNDITTDNIFDIDKLTASIPVMLVTGDIPTLENATNKDTQIVVDVEYTNLQDPTRSFKMTNAAMRPQGTSSMLYPKKNFRLYTKKLAQTKVYDSAGKEIEDKLYSFKEGAVPVNCWCMKADFAESSGTHNTGIARLWQDVLYNATVDGEYVFRTEAQNKAIANGYPYDVRTTIDGYPILMFYRRTKNDAPIFIGKYNFNNDKSTENVFGFTDIPGFDNSRMQCWEVLNNGDALALFTDVSDFDTRWDEAFESRYPDTKTPNTADLKAFSLWLNGVNGNADAFAIEKWHHMNVYMMAAYYVYLMRFGAVDQTVKNSMLTSEDGSHFYFINYDNDTINGLRNNGVLVFAPDIDRQSLDPEGTEGVYAYAGHDSVLWNMLEGDAEFMEIVAKVDNALYANGLSYASVIRMFNDEQAAKWCEKVYNQDAQYKYVSPYTDAGKNNLLMLQGSRVSHRKWWLSKRFALYDSKFVSGDFKNKVLEFKVVNNTAGGWSFGITAGVAMNYGYGVYNPLETGVALQAGESHSFNIPESLTLNIGDPVRIYGAMNLEGVDLSGVMHRLSNINFSSVYDEDRGTYLKKIVIGSSLNENTTMFNSSISGLSQVKRLEYLDIQGCKGLTTLDLSAHEYFKTLKAYGSGLTSVVFAPGAPVESIELPGSMQAVELKQLPKLNTLSFEALNNLLSLTVEGCPLVTKSADLVLNWLSSKVADDSECTLILDNIDWKSVSKIVFKRIAAFKNNGGHLSLKGSIYLATSDQEIADLIIATFGDKVFDKTNELYIYAPDSIFLSGPTSIYAGDTAQFAAVIFSQNKGEVKYYAQTSSSGAVFSINQETGKLTTSESYGYTLTITAVHIPTSGSAVRMETTLYVNARIYPQNVTLIGSANINDDINDYSWTTTTENVNGVMIAEWQLSGELFDGGYVTIEKSSLTTCRLRRNMKSLEVISGTLTLTLKRKFNNSVLRTVTKELVLFDDTILMTSATNPEVMSVMWQAGLCANETYMTKQEAALVTEMDLMVDSTTSIFRKYGGWYSLKTFDEFEYFTGVTKMPDYLFNGTGLTSIKLPPVTVIGERAFVGCVLTEIDIPETVISIGDYAFSGQKLGRLTLPPNIQSIEPDAFYACGLTEVIIPDSAKNLRINSNAFGNNMLTSINLPENIYLYGEVFKNNKIKEVYLRAGWHISAGFSAAFCYNPLEKIEGEQGRYGDSVIEGNCIIDYVNSTYYEVVQGCKNSVIPERVSSIGAGAFEGIPGLTEINLSSNINQIGSNAFYGCPDLLRVVLPDTIKELGDVFRECTKLEYVEMGSSITTLGWTFIQCLSLKNILIKALTAPSASGTFGFDNNEYAGRNTYNTGENMLYVPAGATGYDTGAWLDPLQNAEKCGFTISYSL